MCGFFITNDINVGIEFSGLIESKLRFRGPDSSSGFIDCRNGWRAYHSRLAIIDLDAGVNQPIFDEDNGVLVFNGEILNYKELGYKYFDKEYISDTVLLSDLIKNDLVDNNELDGFFAYVYINGSGKLRSATRDHFGVKPLFYHESEEGYLSFSSEPSLLKEIFSLDVNVNAIEEYKALRSPVFSGSFFNEVSIVNPGTCLINGEYFNVKDKLSKIKDKNKLNIDDLKYALDTGLKTRLVSDAPVGLLLSRGVDSHLLKNMGKFNKLYTIGFSSDEDILYLKNKNYENLTIVEANSEQYKKDLTHLLYTRGEPMSVPNEVLLYRVAKTAAKDGVKVLLSGEGADEFFGGYDRIFQWAKKTNKFNVSDFLRLYCYGDVVEGSYLFRRFENVFSEVCELSVFEQVRWFFIRYHMPVLFRRLDFSLMAAGVEGREPIANMHTFMQAVEYSSEDLMSDQLGKVPLRELISMYMGKEFGYEQKVGFPVDLREIFNHKGCKTSYEIWFEENLKVLGL